MQFLLQRCPRAEEACFMHNLTCLTAIAALIVAAPALGAEQASPVISAWIKTDKGELGQGVLAKTGRGCLLITAGHVIENNVDTVAIRVNGANAAKGAVRAAIVQGADIGFIEPDSGSLPECPAIATDAEIAKALANSDGEIIRITESGQRLRMQVKVVQDAPELIVQPFYPTESLPAGASGAPLVVGGVVVGVVSGVTSPARNGPVQIHIQRLDVLPRAAAAWTAAAGSAEGPGAKTQGLISAKAANFFGRPQRDGFTFSLTLSTASATQIEISNRGSHDGWGAISSTGVECSNFAVTTANMPWTDTQGNRMQGPAGFSTVAGRPALVPVRVLCRVGRGDRVSMNVNVWVRHSGAAEWQVQQFSFVDQAVQ
jgi:hypothetical protein